MECENMEEIVIVWNNEETPEQAGFVNSPSWKRPVIFLKTPKNSMDNRYLLPSESKAKIFFNLDDDIHTSCEELNNSFGVWRKHTLGDIGPLVGYAKRTFNYNAAKTTFSNDNPFDGEFYSYILIGYCWIPRHFLEIYNAQKSWEVR